MEPVEGVEPVEDNEPMEDNEPVGGVGHVKDNEPVEGVILDWGVEPGESQFCVFATSCSKAAWTCERAALHEACWGLSPNDEINARVQL